MKQFLILLAGVLGLVPSSLYSQNSWIQKSEFDSSGRRAAVAFSINSKGYVSTGSSATGSKKELWEYDPEGDSWTQKADIEGEARRFASGFAIGNFGYVGTGDGVNQLDDFWQYDPVANTWDKKKKFPGAKREFAIGFSIGDKGYLGTGSDNFSSTKGDFYEYDPATDSWTQRANVRKTEQAAGFSIGNKGYLAFGDPLDEPLSSELWEYDPTIDDWIEKATCPGTPRASPVAFVIGNKAYIGTGQDTNGVALNDFWEYDPATDTWTEVTPLPAPARYQAIAFAIGDKGYVGTGREESGDIYFSDFYEFSLACVTPAGLTATNIKTTSAKVNWAVEPGAQKYSVRYCKTGTAPWTKTTALSNYKKLTGLMPDTEYDWAVKSVCDAVSNISSDWSATQTFTTKPLRLEDENEMGDVALELYPNPFSSSTTISFSVSENTVVNIEVFDLTGRKLRAIYSGYAEAGEHSIELNGEGLSAGIYLIKAQLNDQQVIKKFAVE